MIVVVAFLLWLFSFFICHNSIPSWEPPNIWRKLQKLPESKTNWWKFFCGFLLVVYILICHFAPFAIQAILYVGILDYLFMFFQVLATVKAAKMAVDSLITCDWTKSSLWNLAYEKGRWTSLFHLNNHTHTFAYKHM